MKILFPFVLLLLLSFAVVFGQSSEELQTINNKSKFQFVKPETLDQLMISLRKYETSPERNQDTLILDTYRSISSAYMANNHFKKAYEVFNKYIRRKEQMLSADKADFLNQKISSVTLKKQSDEKEELELQNRLNEFKGENSHLDSRQTSFKRNFSLGLVMLTAIFALILVSTGLRMISIRSNLLQNRARIINIHKVAVIGNFNGGLRNRLKNILMKSEEQTNELYKIIKKQEQNFTPVKQANQIISGIENIFKEIKENISLWTTSNKT